jgi:hypothetical protein
MVDTLFWIYFYIYSLLIKFTSMFKLFIQSLFYSYSKLKTIISWRSFLIHRVRNILKVKTINSVWYYLIDWSKDCLFRIFSKLAYKRFRYIMPISEFKKHCLITWMTWSGKSEFLKFLFFIYATKKDSSVILLDPHWDVADEIVKSRFIDSDRVVYFSAKLMSSKDSCTHNKNYSDAKGIRYIESSIDCIYWDCNRCSNSLEYIFNLNPFSFRLKEHEKERFASELTLVFQEILKWSWWRDLTLNMKSLLIPSIMVLLDLKWSSIKDLLRFMDDERNEDLVALGLKSKNEWVREFFQDSFYSSMYSLTKQSISLKLQSLLNSEIFRKVLCSNDFSYWGSRDNSIDLRELINKKKILLFNLSKWVLWSEVSSIIWRFIVAMIQSVAISRWDDSFKDDLGFQSWEFETSYTWNRVYGNSKRRGSKRVPTYLFIDEFQNYTTSSIWNILEEARKYNLHLFLATQIIGKKIDGKLKETILANTNVKVIWANSYAQQIMFARESWIDRERLLRLRVWEFMIYSRFFRAKRYRSSRLFIGSFFNKSSVKFKDFIHEQLKRYYWQNSSKMGVEGTNYDLSYSDTKKGKIERNWASLEGLGAMFELE